MLPTPWRPSPSRPYALPPLLPRTSISFPATFRRLTSIPAKGVCFSVAARRLRRPFFRCSSTVSIAGGGDGDEISRVTLLWRAAKLPIYSVALVPLTVGFAAAYLQTGLFFTKRYLVLLSASILVITWLNLSNDVYDFDTGADRNKKESVVNIVGSRRTTQIAAITSLVLGFIGLFWASAQAGDIRFIILMTYAILCGYVYQALQLYFEVGSGFCFAVPGTSPPFRLSYQGLGEPLCFAAFGPFATTAFYLSNSFKGLSSESIHLPLNWTILSASFLVGLTTTMILFCSHFHQIEGDLAVGKMSPLVRLGTKTGSEVVKYGVFTLYILSLSFGLFRTLPPTCILLSALTFPVGKLVIDYVQKNHNDKTKIFMAKYYCVRLHALFGTALALGLLLARR